MTETQPPTQIREATPKDAAAIADIYNHFVANTLITFDIQPISIPDMQQKITDLQKNFPVLVMAEGEQLAGYAYAAAWKTKPAYKHCAETTIYMHPSFHHKGLGARLYNALLTSLQLFEIANAIACITIPNDDSIKLHQKLGFRKVGRFEKVGYKKEQWIDVEYWQKKV